MTVAYVDSSCLVAIAFDEPGADELAARLRSHEWLVSSNLLEAEFHATLVREGVSPEEGDDLLSWVTWILPDRSLRDEIRRVTEHGYLRGADLWHVACALFLVEANPEELFFETLDRCQRDVASLVGFSLGQ